MDLSFTRLPLPDAGHGIPIPPRALDAYYAWASATGYAHFGGRPDFFLVAFEMRLTVQKKMEAVRTLCETVFVAPDATLHAPWWNNTHVYGTAVVNRAGLRRVEQAAAAGDVRRFEVALTPQPTRSTGPSAPLQPGKPGASPPTCRSRVLVGMVDYGCPFANSRLRLASGRTRVLSFWQQGGALNVPGASPPAPWSFGMAASQAQLDAFRAGWSAADDWALYRNAGLPELCRDASHGAHILGCLFGAHANSTLLWQGQYDQAPQGGPSALQDEVPDLVFVQLPSTYVQGVPRGALGGYRLAALEYILASAGPQTTDIVVPLSSETYDGSHDGQSLYDTAAAALIEHARATLGITMHVLVSAGNTLRTNTHEHVDLQAAGGSHTFRVRVLPGNERHTFVEVWAPHTLDDLQFALLSPKATGAPAFVSGDGTWSGSDALGRPVAGIVSLQQGTTFGGHQRLVLFILPPTHAAQGAGGEVGDWRVLIRRPGAPGDVFAYISRSTPALGGAVRSYQSTFPRRFSRDWDFPSGAPAGRGRPYDRHSISGLATGSGVTVVGSYQARGRLRSQYSAAGPARPPSAHPQFLIDAAAPADESSNALGIVGWGNRSAGFTRRAGTSVAAPLVARAVVRLRALPPRAQGPTAREDPQVPIPEIIR